MSSLLKDTDNVDYWKHKYETLERKYLELTKGKVEEADKSDSIELKVLSPFEIAESVVEKSQKSVKLVIEKGYDDPKKQDYSNIKSIVIKHFDLIWKGWFKSHEFTGIEELCIKCSLETEDIDDDYDSWKWVVQFNMQAIFSGMINLKHLYLRSEIPRFYDEICAPFKLESADVFCMYPFIESSSETLKQLKICLSGGYGGMEFGITELLNFYYNYKQLENLSAVFCLDSDDLLTALPKKDTIKHLDIHVYIMSKNDSKIKESSYLEFILASSPSLESLTIYIEISAAFIQFLARSMPNLKKLIGRGGIESSALTFFDELNAKTNFKIILEENCPWQKVFEGSKCR